MTFVVAALFALLFAGVAWVARQQGRVIRTRLRNNVVVSLKGGATFRGVLCEIDSSALVLRDAHALGNATSASAPVDGELIIFRADVDYMQRP